MPSSIRKFSLPAAAALLIVEDVNLLLLTCVPSHSVCICLLILDAGASATKEEAARYTSRYSSVSSRPNCWSTALLLELARIPYIKAAVLHELVTSCSCWIVNCRAAPCMNDSENAEQAVTTIAYAIV